VIAGHYRCDYEETGEEELWIIRGGFWLSREGKIPAARLID